MKKVKLFKNIVSDADINEFLANTRGQLVDIKFCSSIAKLPAINGTDPKMGCIASALIIYDDNTSGGGMK